MLRLKGYNKIFPSIAMFLAVFIAAPAIAATLTLSSGQEIDLTARQVELLKGHEGIYFFHYPPRKIISGELQYWVFIELPEEFGGGFIIGKPDKVTAAIDTVRAEKEAGETDPSIVRGKKAGSWFQTEFLLSTGYRVDDLDWNIAGDINGYNPNILSELEWKGLESFQLKIANKTVFNQLFLLRGSLAYGWIFDGENQDSDYLGDDRTFEFSRSNNNSDDGNVLDASFGIGWQFTFGRSDFVMVPVIGYSYHEQNLTITDGCQTIPPSGPFSGLNSTYETEWKGLWIGLDFTFRTDEKSKISPEIETFISIEYHWADYYAEADWNLRTDFAHPKSFEHEADGHGIVFSTVIRFLLDYHWVLNVNFDYQNWSTDPGTDKVFFSNGTIGETQLNEVNWTSYAIMAGIEYHF
ncbi:MAG: hypothetical protein U9R43_16695 [Thermodesulfobacteriota bacterium]|nr:hypothetical protein [Thermodesulfobacteriota bacterium]